MNAARSSQLMMCKQMFSLFSAGHEGCRDQGPHRERQGTSPARSVHQVKVHALLFVFVRPQSELKFSDLLQSHN